MLQSETMEAMKPPALATFSCSSAYRPKIAWNRLTTLPRHTPSNSIRTFPGGCIIGVCFAVNGIPTFRPDGWFVICSANRGPRIGKGDPMESTTYAEHFGGSNALGLLLLATFAGIVAGSIGFVLGWSF